MNALTVLVSTTLAMLQGRLSSRRDKGATMVEYGLIVALIAIVVIAAVTLVGSHLSTLFNTIAAKL